MRPHPHAAPWASPLPFTSRRFGAACLVRAARRRPLLCGTSRLPLMDVLRGTRVAQSCRAYSLLTRERHDHVAILLVRDRYSSVFVRSFV
jgi:hypothetical protein